MPTRVDLYEEDGIERTWGDVISDIGETAIDIIETIKTPRPIGTTPVPPTTTVNETTRTEAGVYFGGGFIVLIAVVFLAWFFFFRK